MLPGIRVSDLKQTPDERGSFAEIMRNDWQELLDGDTVAQANLSLSYPGIIRAWHRHNRGQVDYFIVLRGSLKICAYDDDPRSPTKGKLDEIIVSSTKLQVVRIPGRYWHGTKAVGNEPAQILYLVNRLYDYKNPDEERRPWDDPAVIDPRIGQPYDWNKPPHK